MASLWSCSSEGSRSQLALRLGDSQGAVLAFEISFFPLLTGSTKALSRCPSPSPHRLTNSLSSFILGSPPPPSPSFFLLVSPGSFAQANQPSAAATMCLHIAEVCSQCQRVTLGSILTKPCGPIAQLLGSTALDADVHPLPLPGCTTAQYVDIPERFERSCTNGCVGEGETGRGYQVLNQLLAEAEERYHPASCPIAAPWTGADTVFLRRAFVDLQVSHYRRWVREHVGVVTVTISSTLQQSWPDDADTSVPVQQHLAPAGLAETYHPPQSGNWDVSGNDWYTDVATSYPAPFAPVVTPGSPTASQSYHPSAANASMAIYSNDDDDDGDGDKTDSDADIAPAAAAPAPAAAAGTAGTRAARQPRAATRHPPWSDEEVDRLKHCRNVLKWSISQLAVSTYSHLFVLSMLGRGCCVKRPHSRLFGNVRLELTCFRYRPGDSSQASNLFPGRSKFAIETKVSILKKAHVLDF
ncbi:hypothetical protein VTK26DRAFT_1182 [Humicola hyalothermophila]